MVKEKVLTEEEKLMKKIKEQDEKLNVKLQELVELIKSYEGWSAGFGEYACREIAIWAGDGDYEMLGILETAKLGLREVCLENEKEDQVSCLCPECQAKADAVSGTKAN